MNNCRITSASFTATRSHLCPALELASGKGRLHQQIDIGGSNQLRVLDMARFISLCLCVLVTVQLPTLTTAFFLPPVALRNSNPGTICQQQRRCPPTSSSRRTSRAQAFQVSSGGLRSRWHPVDISRPLGGVPRKLSANIGHDFTGIEGEEESAMMGVSQSLNTASPAVRQSRYQGAAARIALTAASALVAAGLAVAFVAPGPALAAATKAGDYVNAGLDPSEHMHVGQKIANFFRRGGLPDWATLMTISAMPVVELRGGVPVGIWMGMPLLKTFGLCVAGNMIPIPVILLALRSQFVQKLAKPVLDRAREKAKSFGDEKSQALALTLFVGIPLPGTGAWTGAMGAFLLGMPFGKAMLSIFLGVVSAGLIMSCLTLAGKAGALVATAVLAVFCVSSILSGGEKTKASDNASP